MSRRPVEGVSRAVGVTTLSQSSGRHAFVPTDCHCQSRCRREPSGTTRLNTDNRCCFRRLPVQASGSAAPSNVTRSSARLPCRQRCTPLPTGRTLPQVSRRSCRHAVAAAAWSSWSRSSAPSKVGHLCSQPETGKMQGPNNRRRYRRSPTSMTRHSKRRRVRSAERESSEMTSVGRSTDRGWPKRRNLRWCT